jgi:hypothetical protein
MGFFPQVALKSTAGIARKASFYQTDFEAFLLG